MFLLAILSAIAGTPQIGEGIDYTIQRPRLDAWAFSHRYDPPTHQVLRTSVSRRRLFYSTGMGLGGAMLFGGLVINSQPEVGTTAPSPVPGYIVGGIGLGLLVGLPIWYGISKGAMLRPQRYWTAQEARALAGRKSIHHGMRIEPTASGWGVVNRTGRWLTAEEVALRLNDRYMRRKIQRQSRAAVWGGFGLSVVGFASALAGAAMLHDTGRPEVYRVQGAGVLATGLVLLPAGMYVQATLGARRPQHYWDRKLLERQLAERER